MTPWIIPLIILLWVRYLFYDKLLADISLAKYGSVAEYLELKWSP